MCNLIFRGTACTESFEMASLFVVVVEVKKKNYEKKKLTKVLTELVSSEYLNKSLHCASVAGHAHPQSTQGRA